MGCLKDLSDDSYTKKLLSEMRTRLEREGKTNATISKYLSDAGKFIRYAAEQQSDTEEIPDSDVLNNYREYILDKYKISSANSILAGANYFLECSGRTDLRLRSCRIQKAAFREDDKELTVNEYHRLVRAASKQGNERLCMIMLTLGATGIRISELPFITVESLADKQAIVSLKGKTRHVIIPSTLCSRLEDYSKKKGISSGSLFITRSGKPVDRSNVLHDMKKLCDIADIDPRKVHPHNFRHLFAVSFYDKYKDICHLADILGHSNINTTRIYTARSRGELARSLENLGLIDDLSV